MMRFVSISLLAIWSLFSCGLPLALAYTSHGELLQDETWEGEVLLTGDVVVPVGRTLTIRPGARIRYQPGVSEIKVFGTLNLAGEPADPIQFIEMKPVSTDAIQTIEIQPVDTEPLREEVKAFTNQYLILWTILSFGWFYALNNR